MRRRARFSYRIKTELVGGEGSPANETTMVIVFTWLRWRCDSRAVGRGGATTEIGDAAVRGGRSGVDGAVAIDGARRRRRWIPRGAAELAGVTAVENGAERDRAVAERGGAAAERGRGRRRN